MTPDNKRPLRANGKALEMALDMIYSLKIQSSRIALFIGGPPTISEGRVAS